MLCKGQGRQRARPGLGLAGRPGEQWVLPPASLEAPGAHRASSSLPIAPQPPRGGQRTMGPLLGAAVTEERRLSTVEELPPQGAWQRLRADAHAGEPGRGRPRSPRTNIAHLFLLTAETSKLRNYK